MEHPYPDHAYLECDDETDAKRWYSTKGMGVRYVHEDRAAEDVDVAVTAERERCAKIVEKLSGADCVYPEGLRLLVDAIRNLEPK